MIGSTVRDDTVSDEAIRCEREFGPVRAGARTSSRGSFAWAAACVFVDGAAMMRTGAGSAALT